MKINDNNNTGMTFEIRSKNIGLYRFESIVYLIPEYALMEKIDAI